MSILSYDHVIDCHCDMLLSASNSEYSGGNVFAIPDNLKEVMKVLLLDRLAARGDYARLGVAPAPAEALSTHHAIYVTVRGT